METPTARALERHRSSDPVTETLILNTLGKEFSIQAPLVQATLEMVDAGLGAPFIGRFRRAATGGLTAFDVSKLVRRRDELDELGRRRGTIVRGLEQAGVTDKKVLETIQSCVQRFELEDLFVPHRRPEPEVQLALDRGLGPLAERLVAGVPGDQREPTDAGEEDGRSQEEDVPSESDDSPVAQATPDDPEPAPAEEPAESEEGAEPGAAAQPEDTAEPAEAAEPEKAAEPEEDAQPEEPAGPEGAAEPKEAAEPEEPSQAAAVKAPEDEVPTPAAGADAPTAHLAGLEGEVVITPELVSACEPFVNPDRGVHTEQEAIAGAIRILSDRLGRNAQLRTTIRRMLRKQGVLSVKLLVAPSKAGRHKPLLNLCRPISQLQGGRLLALRQAQKERVLTTVLDLDPSLVIPKMRRTLGRFTHPALSPLLDAVCLQALKTRLMPAVEEDVRLELKERADGEALRFLSNHLRQVLLTPLLGERPVCGMDVSAKGDWNLAFVAANGAFVAQATIEVGEKDAATLGAELAPLLAEHDCAAVAVANGKGPRASVSRVRAALLAASSEITVTLVNEAGLSGYASSSLAREELADCKVPHRAAVSLARRLQDPLAELLKVDARHLGLGYELGLVSKANARRVLDETIEATLAYVGCDVNSASKAVLSQVPGLDREVADKLIERRSQAPFESREALREGDLLTEAQWTNAVAFLRIPGAADARDRTGLHPEQYPLVEKMLESCGGEALGKPGVTKGLRRSTFEVDEETWRDLMRELTYPGRDPRRRLSKPELLSPDTDPLRLTQGRVVDGIVTSVTGFAAFVDVGLAQEAIIHISDLSDHYVRDARELISIGQVVRAKIKDASGRKLALTLKGVPAPGHKREGGSRPGGGSGPRREGRDARGGGRGGRDKPAGPPRRGELIGGGRSRRPGGPGARGDRKGRPERLTREDRADLDRLNKSASEDAAYNPFASFFKGEGGEQQEAQPEPAPSKGSEPEVTPEVTPESTSGSKSQKDS
jgi:uncharacterized protein